MARDCSRELTTRWNYNSNLKSIFLILTLSLSLAPLTKALAQTQASVTTASLGATSVQTPPELHSKFNHVCQHRNFDQLRVDWCIDYGDRKRNPDVIYNFHGSGGDANNWQDSADNREIAKEWARRHVAPPTVVTFTFGDEWLLTDVPLYGQTPLYKLAVEQVIPQIERELQNAQGSLERGSRSRGRRFLLGLSMGGFNGAELLLKDGDFFDRVALICPVMSQITPFSTSQEVDDFVARHQPYVALKTVTSLMRDLREEFPTPEIYAKHDPLVLIEHAQVKASHLFISCADDDGFGFFDGAKKFAEVAKSRGANVIWAPTHGGHCVEDPQALAEFFAP